MGGRFRAAVLAAAVLVCGSATGGEFGNIYGSAEVEKASREASASALKAIGNIVEGLRQRELQESNGADAFEAASAAFLAAADQMDKLVELVPESPLSDVVVSRLSAATDQEAKTLRDVYRAFSSETRFIGTLIRDAKLAELPNAFAVIGDRLARYFMLAELVVQAQAK